MRKPLEIKRGVTRIAILAGDYAFKIPCFVHGWKNFLQGLLGNMQESMCGRAAGEQSPAGEGYFCPVVFSLWGGWLVVMPRCQSVDRNTFLPDVEEFFRGLEVDTWARRGLVEPKPDSFGVLNGRMVALDYGS